MGNNQKNHKRQKILDTTYRLISENGFHGTAMSRVAKEAGVSAGIIYHYFESKHELIVELFKSIRKEFNEALLEDFDQSQPLSAQIRYVGEQTFRHSLQHPKKTIFLELFYASPYYDLDLDRQVNQNLEPIMNCVRKAREELIIKDLSIQVLNTLFMDVAHSLVRKKEAGLLELTDELVDLMVNSLWEAIRY